MSELDKYRLKARELLAGWRTSVFGALDNPLEDRITNALAEAARETMERVLDKWDIMIESMRALAESDNFRGTDFARILLSYVKDAEAIRKELP